MIDRRNFMKGSLVGGVPRLRIENAYVNAKDADLAFRLLRDVPMRMYDRRRCWCHLRAGIVPGAGKDNLPQVVMTMNTLDVSGSDGSLYVARIHRAKPNHGAVW